MPISNRERGKKGENIFCDAIFSEWKNRYLFEYPCFLGGDFPVLDYYVQLNIESGNPVYFLAQIKSTISGYNNDNHLKIRYPIDKLKLFAKSPAPTYVFGVDIRYKRVYARFIKSPISAGLYSMPTNFELTPSNIRQLHNEVIQYWRASGSANFKTTFKSVTHD